MIRQAFGVRKNEPYMENPNLTEIAKKLIQMKSRHFDTTEVIVAESQAVLNILIGHNFQDAFKVLEMVLMHGSGLLRG
jgi:hypothetical protein